MADKTKSDTSQTPDDDLAVEPIADLSFLPDTIDIASSLSTVTADDLRHYNAALKTLALTWRRCFTVDDVCKLAMTTIKVLEGRRKIMQLPYGEKRQEKGKLFDAFEEPIDDDEIDAVYKSSFS